MSDLLIIAFDDEAAAFELDSHLQPLRADSRLKSEDTAIATRDSQGHVRIHGPNDGEPRNIPLAQTAGGTIWGLVIGAAFAVPVAGAVTGAAAGALVGRDRDPKVKPGYLNEIAETLRPGGSALCLLVHEMDHKALAAALESFPKPGRLVTSPFTGDDEAALRAQVETGAAD